MASLRLEARPQTIDKLQADNTQKSSFRILLAITEKTEADEVTAQWQDIEIISTLESWAVGR